MLENGRGNCDILLSESQIIFILKWNTTELCEYNTPFNTYSKRKASTGFLRAAFIEIYITVITDKDRTKIPAYK